MKIETRKRGFNDSSLILICETEEERKKLDQVFGKKVKDDGHISETKGQVKLSDGFREHYIELSAS